MPETARSVRTQLAPAIVFRRRVVGGKAGFLLERADLFDGLGPFAFVQQMFNPVKGAPQPGALAEKRVHGHDQDRSPNHNGGDEHNDTASQLSQVD